MERRGDNSYSHSVLLLVLIMVIIALVIYIQRESHTAEVAEQLTSQMESAQPEAESYKLSPFDPNTVELKELLQMGLTKNQALSLLRYRASGKVFNIKEEVIACYGFSDSLYFVLEPYIVIGEEFQYKKPEPYKRSEYRNERREAKPLLVPSTFLIDTVGIKYLQAIGALSQRQAEVFVRWRDRSGIHSLDELKACYTVSDSVAVALSEYAIFTEREKAEAEPTKQKPTKPELVDLNNADSTALRSVYGIGEKSVVAIMKYRAALGGFYSKEQLLELDVITDSNYEKIITQILVDSCDISKIDVNFALAKRMSRHPYLEPKLRRLLHKRQMKGGWSTIEEMIDDKIFTREEAQRVQPYLRFVVQPSLN